MLNWMFGRESLSDKLDAWKDYSLTIFNLLMFVYAIIILLLLVFGWNALESVRYYYQNDGESFGDILLYGLIEVGAIIAFAVTLPATIYCVFTLLKITFVISLTMCLGMIAYAAILDTEVSTRTFDNTLTTFGISASLLIGIWLIKVIIKVWGVVEGANNDARSTYYDRSLTYESPVLTNYHIPGYRQREEQQERQEQEKNRQWEQEIKERDESIKDWMYNK